MQATGYAEFNALLIEVVNEIENREMWEAEEMLTSCCPTVNSLLWRETKFWGGPEPKLLID